MNKAVPYTHHTKKLRPFNRAIDAGISPSRTKKTRISKCLGWSSPSIILGLPRQFRNSGLILPPGAIQLVGSRNAIAGDLADEYREFRRCKC